MEGTPATTPDRWSLTAYFSAFGAEDYVKFKVALAAEVAALQSATGDVATRLVAWEALAVRIGHLSSYLGCLSSDDSTNEAVKADEAWLASLDAGRLKGKAALQAALAEMDDAAFEKLTSDPSLADAGHAVRRMREDGRRQMAAEMESLAAELNVDGLHAWSRLYNTLTGKLSFDMTWPDGHTESVPMARRRALMADPDRGIRLAAFRDGQKPWQDHADTMAAGLNGIAGARLSLYARRGGQHFLEAPLFDGALSRAALDAMFAAIHENIELPRRILRAASRLQGTPALHYADLEAPHVPAPQEKPIPWTEACRMVQDAFDAAYPAFGAYFRSMLENEWIESQPRAGKRPGAFCTGSRLIDQERVYMTYHETVHDIITLAHEAGHAWHAFVLRPARALAADYPMTLAETASNFGEMILLDGLASGPSATPALKAYLLDQEMCRASAYLLNIPMRFEFERRFYEERAAGEVPVSRLSELMIAAQRTIYGDTIAPGDEDPLFWASKVHFFISEVSFYNFPYVFGFLLSQALAARFRQDGPAFLRAYEAFLGATGRATCEEVARDTLGADLTSPGFWATGIAALGDAVGAYEKLAP